jgi:hypothetical protein
MSENVGASISRNPKGLHGLYGDNFTFTLLFIPEDKFILPEIRLFFSELNSIIYQKMEISITTALSCSSPEDPGCLLHEKQKKENIKYPDSFALQV